MKKNIIRESKQTTEINYDTQSIVLDSNKNDYYLGQETLNVGMLLSSLKGLA